MPTDKESAGGLLRPALIPASLSGRVSELGRVIEVLGGEVCRKAWCACEWRASSKPFPRCVQDCRVCRLSVCNSGNKNECCSVSDKKGCSTQAVKVKRKSLV